MKIPLFLSLIKIQKIQFTFNVHLIIYFSIKISFAENLFSVPYNQDPIIAHALGTTLLGPKFTRTLKSSIISFNILKKLLCSIFMF